MTIIRNYELNLIETRAGAASKMMEEGGKPERAEQASPLAVEHFKFVLVAVLASSLWTVLGAILAYVQNDLGDFVDEWRRVEVFPVLAFAVWLLLLARSNIFSKRVKSLTQNGMTVPSGLSDRRVVFSITLGVCCLAAATSIGMGFNAKQLLLGFFWATAILSGWIAGLVMVHTIDVIVVIHKLQTAKVKTFHYSPARTPELRNVVSYFATFALILSAAYLFAFLGTINGRWTGNPLFIEAVQFFWPIVYVPICSVALLYPHIAVHWLIQQEKERTLSSYQQEIDDLLTRYETLKGKDIDRVNTLAQFFDRLSATPDYVVDLGIGLRTVTPLLFNLTILLAKHFIGQS